MFDCSKSESLRDVSVTRIGDTLSHSSPQTVTYLLIYFQVDAGLVHIQIQVLNPASLVPEVVFSRELDSWDA